MGFSALDLAIVAVYLAGSVAFGTWVGRGQQDTSDYFLGGRHMPWPAVTFSIVATETSTLTFISIPAITYLGNMTFLQIALGYVLGRVVVALVMVPAYYRGNITTAYHFLGERFGPRLRKLTSVTFMGTRLLADGVRTFATAIPLAVIIKGSGAFEGLSDSQLYAISIVAIGVLTIVYTYLGGIRSVIWMDVIQMATYMAGALIAAAIILYKLPLGWDSVVQAAASGDKLRWFDTGFGMSFGEFITKPYTFFTALLAGAIFSLASHGTDQIIVQRVLTCRNVRDSQKAMIASGIIVFVQFVVFLLMGVMLYAFYEGASIQELGLARADGIFPKFIVEEIPTGLSGLIVAALFAAAMSTLSSTLSSLSSALVLDLYVPMFGRGKSEAQLLTVSRLVTLLWGAVLVGVALLFIGLEGTVVEVALGIASYTYGGLLGAFLLGLASRQVTERDAILGFIAALIVMTVLIQTVQIAWPLYTVVGSLTTVAVGLLTARLFPRPATA